MSQDNASCFQYPCPSPTPTWTVGTPTPGPPLPNTGHELGTTVSLAALMVVLGVCGLTLTGEWFRVWRENRASRVD